MKGKKQLQTKEVEVLAPPRVIREKLNLSQDEFALLLGVKVRTLRD
jgi:DNA-binding transcriptional regulator YiaG